MYIIICRVEDNTCGQFIDESNIGGLQLDLIFFLVYTVCTLMRTFLQAISTFL